jgi:uncharacterized membrane protein YsdA (DUF1294 family)
MRYLFYYLILINAVGFVIMLADKIKAKRGAWRIPEATLLTVAAIGGSLGAFLGMYLFRHKTKHPKFTVTVPLLLILHVVALLRLYKTL